MSEIFNLHCDGSCYLPNDGQRIRGAGAALMCRAVVDTLGGTIRSGVGRMGHSA